MKRQNSAVGIQFSVGLSALGSTVEQLQQHLIQQKTSLTFTSGLIPEKSVWVGAFQADLIEQVPEVLQSVDSRNLRFALTALQKIEPEIQQYVQNFERSRLAIVLGTSTSGIADNEPVLAEYFKGNPEVQVYQHKQEMGCLSKAVQQYLGWEGLAYTISTACSSGAKTFAAGQRLINAGLADAVLVGGVDTLCKLTLNGFNSLESLSNDICRPCGQQRDGINIGEAAALFLLSKENADVMLLATGESMDAWHISAPHPEGQGAAEAMRKALMMAEVHSSEIGYLNMHGTATLQNDAMEVKAVRQVFQDFNVPLSSTKHQTGHCLGAAGAIEAFICMQVLRDQSWLPLHHQGVLDAELDDLNYVEIAQLDQSIDYVMSNSFAFGGSNISLIFGTKMK
ncbi:beta-ketoacyl-[acyl-carrier-protein] synthase family protein [Acinetobacter silvestris]|nr:beta-ketoacyl-[acyl-carrier-protein] synthase family protein [Acinetobacter silvestris]